MKPVLRALRHPFSPGAIKKWIGRTALPLARWYIRYSPIDLFKNFIWTRTHWREHRYVCRTRFGAVMAGSSLDLVQGYIYYFGVWEPNLSAFVEDRLKRCPERVFVDVGANVGYFSLLAARHLTRGEVVAIEAFPAIYAKLEANIRLNKLGNVRTVACAVTDIERTLQMFHAGSANEGGTTSLGGRFDSRPVEVKGLPLTRLLTEEEIHNLRLIKIDVEGAEHAVVLGMRPIVSRLRNDAEIAVEIDPSALGPQKVAELFDVFAQAGFFSYALKNSYAPSSYLQASRVSRPVRMPTLPDGPTDVVFSKIDAESL